MTGFLPPPHVGPVLFCSVLFVYLVLCCWQPDVLEILEQIWMLTLLYLPRPAVWSLDWLSSVSLRFLHKTEPFDVFLRGYNPGHTSQSPEAPTLQLGFPWPHPACPTRNGITPSWWAPLMWSWLLYFWYIMKHKRHNPSSLLFRNSNIDQLWSLLLCQESSLLSLLCYLFNFLEGISFISLGTTNTVELLALF